MLCPACGGEGKSVSLETVKNLAREDMKKNIVGDDYYICNDIECKTAYYDIENQLVLSIDDISVPIWYKANAKPIYACYCNEVTVEEVKSAIQEHACKTIKDLMKFTKVMINGQCKTNHPYGQCCSTQLNKILKEY